MTTSIRRNSPWKRSIRRDLTTTYIDITKHGLPVGTVVFDNSDAPQILSYVWRVNMDGYPITNVKVGDKWTILELHRIIFPAPREGRIPLEVDHIDRDKMNNRRSNLRHVTHQMNQRNKDCVIAAWNRPKPPRLHRAPGTGCINWCKRVGLYCARLRSKHLAYAETWEAAEQIINKARIDDVWKELFPEAA